MTTYHQYNICNNKVYQEKRAQNKVGPRIHYGRKKPTIARKLQEHCFKMLFSLTSYLSAEEVKGAAKALFLALRRDDGPQGGDLTI